MDSLASGSPKTLTFDLGSAEFTITAVNYAVYDENDQELVPTSPVTGWSSGDLEALVTVDGANNTLPEGAFRGGRQVLLWAVDGAGKMLALRQSYALVLGAVLRIPETSLVTMTGAEMLAAEMMGLQGWPAADEQMRTKALLAARDKIASLLLRDNGKYGRDYAGYDSAYAGYGLSTGTTFRLSDLTVGEWDATSSELKRAVRQAQVAQADFLLTPGSGQEGSVRSIVIGESSRTYFQGVKTPLAAPAMRYLGRFIAPARTARG